MLNEEEKHLREQIIFVLDNPDSESNEFVPSFTADANADILKAGTFTADANADILKASTSIVDNLDILGNVVIILGGVFGLILVLFGTIEKVFLMAIWGFAGILSALISGYILKALSKIIILLSASQVSNNDT
tara:strand:- start:579 stop:977 length:399 start_codon:yes stop_codon:yes gene_type:complete